MIRIGIDPGKTGAIACIDSDEACVWDTPMIGRDYDVRGMADILSRWTDATGVFACIELAQPMPREGTRSSWTNGYGYGLWIGILASLAIPYAAVRPGIWKRHLGVTRDKNQTRARARELFPLIDLSLKKHHGRAEALLLAVYTEEKKVSLPVSLPVLGEEDDPEATWLQEKEHMIWAEMQRTSQ